MITTLKYDNCIVNVHKPALSDEERARRQKELYKAAERFAKKKAGTAMTAKRKNA